MGKKAAKSLDKDKVLCLADEQGGRWEAFCVDFDLAVQGSSFSEVSRKLEDQISLFLEEVQTLPEADRRRLLRRRMPRLVYLWHVLRIVVALLSRSSARGSHHDYTLPLGGRVRPGDLAHA